MIIYIIINIYLGNPLKCIEAYVSQKIWEHYVSIFHKPNKNSFY